MCTKSKKKNKKKEKEKEVSKLIRLQNTLFVVYGTKTHNTFFISFLLWYVFLFNNGKQQQSSCSLQFVIQYVLFVNGYEE